MREAGIGDALDLAGLIADQVALAADLPFAFFGHSMGALLAFETARALRRRQGPRPTRLFVSGFGGPHLKPFRPPLRNLSEPAFRAELRAYGGTPAEVLADDDFMEFLSPLLRRDLGICETYTRPDEPRLETPITAFGGDSDETVPWGRLLAWSDQTNADFQARFLPGEHFFIKAAAPLVCELIAQGLRGDEADGRLAPPGPREVHLWTVPVDLDGPDAAPDAKDRARLTTTRIALRNLLHRYGDGQPPLEFAVGAAGAMGLIAFTSGGAVGVDVTQAGAGSTLLARQGFTITRPGAGTRSFSLAPGYDATLATGPAIDQTIVRHWRLDGPPVAP
jgi:medium-chain acyl-[acyl-carrier-protein] hydrolase